MATEYLTTREAAELVGLTPAGVTWAMKKRRVRAKVDGQQKSYPRAEVEQWMADRAAKGKGATRPRDGSAAPATAGNGSIDEVVRTIAQKRNELQDERVGLEAQRDMLEHRIQALHAQEDALEKAIEALQGNASC